MTESDARIAKVGVAAFPLRLAVVLCILDHGENYFAQMDLRHYCTDRQVYADMNIHLAVARTKGRGL